MCNLLLEEVLIGDYNLQSTIKYFVCVIMLLLVMEWESGVLQSTIKYFVCVIECKRDL